MALSDYYLCDICGNKTFCDHGVLYDEAADAFSNPKIHGVGDMAVICEECAETHKVIIAIKESNTPTTQAGGGANNSGS